MQFLQYFQNEFVRTELLARHLEGLGLFVPQGAYFAAPSGHSFLINHFFKIGE